MKICTAKKISTQQHLNNEFEVVSIHKSFDLAIKNVEPAYIVVEISDDIKRGDSINNDGKKWTSI